jgi:periplasmic divalent cation tolerance protein
MAACLVLTSVGDRKSAGRLAKRLVSDRLAACVTGLPDAVSHYRWKGNSETSREVLLLIKTDRRSWPKLRNFLKKNHPYELPEILMLPVSAGSKEYLSWLDSSLKK